LATGSEPIALPGIPFDQRRVLSSTEALSLREVPKRLLVIGGGAIGLELASVYQRLGCQVTVIEMLDRLCPAMDRTLSKNLYSILKKQGIAFSLSTKVVSAVVQPDEVILTIECEEKLESISGEKVLVAIGRKPYTQGLGLEKVGVVLSKRGYVQVDEQFRTSVPSIFAIGDMIDGPMLAHKASEEGLSVVDSFRGVYRPVNYLSIPTVVYTQPEAAGVGLTEEEAREAGFTTASGTAYFKGNPRARCMGETDGLVKIIGDSHSGRLLGMHIIGPQASELIGEGMLAMQKGMIVKELAEAPHAHPTLSEAIKEAAIAVRISRD
jgi:dihydrolipoamide dehydrogenase